MQNASASNPLHRKKLKRAIATLGESGVLELSRLPIGAEAGQELAQAIAAAPQMHELSLLDCEFSDEAADALFAALSQHDGLRETYIKGDCFSEARLDGFLHAIRNHRGLRQLLLEDNQHLHGSNADVLVDTVQSLPQLVSLRLLDAELSQGNTLTLGETLSARKELNYLWINASSPEARAQHDLLRECVFSTEHPQLVFYHDSAGEASSLTHDAREALQAGQAALLAAQEDGSLPLRFGDIATVFAMQESLQCTEDGPAQLAALYARLPAPVEPEVQALFATGADGLAPIETPQQWQRHPDLLRQLTASGQWDAAMQARTQGGADMVQCALAFGEMDSVLAALRENGMAMPQVLAHETQEGTPSTERIVERRGEVANCFSHQHWKGQTPQAYVAMFRNLEPANRGKVPSPHAVRQLLAEERQTQDAVRGR